MASSLFLPEFAPDIVCTPDGHVDTVEEVASSLFLPEFAPDVRGASKIKLKNVNKKRMATARRLIFLGISQGIHC